jgi:hypothetical protein
VEIYAPDSRENGGNIMKKLAPEETINNYQSRAFRYWVVDGIAELGIGFIVSLVSTIYYLQETFPESLLIKILNFIAVILVLSVGFGGWRIIQRIKVSTTYPRTGYVAYKGSWKNKGNIMIAVVVGGLILAFVVFTTVTGTKLANWWLVFSGLILGILFLQDAYRFTLPRFYILAFLSLLIGSVLVVSGLNLALSFPLFWGLNGLILLFSGGVTLWKYLRRRPFSTETIDEQ